MPKLLHAADIAESLVVGFHLAHRAQIHFAEKPANLAALRVSLCAGISASQGEDGTAHLKSPVDTRASRAPGGGR